MMRLLKTENLPKKIASAFLMLTILFSMVWPPFSAKAEPTKPTNELPSNGATGVYLTPTLEASPFEESDWYDSSWQHRVALTIDADEVDSDLTNFPVYVNLANLPTEFHNHVKSDGGDIRITLADGETEIPREVVFYDAGTDTGELHFKAPSISSSTDTTFYIYYGNSSASDYAPTDTNGRNNVWSDYAAVLHLNSSDYLIDSTGKHSPSAVNSGAFADVSGEVGGGKDFGTNGSINLGNASTLDATSNITVSFWNRSASVPTGSSQFIYSRRTSSGNGISIFRLSNADFHWDLNGTGFRWDTNQNPSQTDNVWKKFDFTYDGAVRRMYQDGSQVASSNATATPNNANSSGLIGRDSAGSNPYRRDMDEFRLQVDITRNADWINAEHTNQSSPATFYTAGTEESLPAHQASQWQITETSGNYTSPVFDSGTDTINLESITLSSPLSPTTTYYWRVRYQDSNNNWSSWSDETSFTTVSTLDPETTALLARMTTQPSAYEIDIIDETIVGIKSDFGISTLDEVFDAMWFFNAHSKQAANLNWVKNANTITEVNGSVRWNRFEGYAGGENDNYLNTNYIPSVHGINYTQNNASLGSYTDWIHIRPNGNHVAMLMAENEDANNVRMSPRQRNTNNTVATSLRVNGSTTLSTGTAFSVPGLYVGRRTNSTSISMHLDGVTQIANTTSNSSSALTNASIKLLRLGEGTNVPLDTLIKFSFFGRSLTTDEQQLLTARVRTYINKMTFNPQLWLDARDLGSITITSSAVSVLNDKSGNGYNFTQGTAASRPVPVAGASPTGRQILRFDGTNDVLRTGSTNLLRNVSGSTIYMVSKLNGSVGARRDMFVMSTNASGGLRSGIFNSLVTTQKALYANRTLDADSRLDLQSAADMDTNWHLYAGSVNNVSAQAQLFIDKVLINSASGTITASNTSDTASAVSALGNASSSGDYPSDMDWGEVLVFHENHDANTRNMISDYLLEKWIAEAADLPTVATDGATSISYDSATLNGEVTDDGGDNIVRRGFVYGLADEGNPGNVNPNVSDWDFIQDESGTFGEEAFDLPVTGLTPETVYYFRAFAENSEGYSYGNVESFTTTGSGSLEVSIIDNDENIVMFPSVLMSSTDFSFSNQMVSGVFGISSEKIRVANPTASATWTLSLAAEDGATALWQSGSNYYDFNDGAANAEDGADDDTFGGQMTINPSGATITPESGCSLTGVSTGSSASFEEGVLDSITLVSASSGTDTNCYWDIQDIDILQTIPAEQPVGSYSINMTLSVIAS